MQFELLACCVLAFQAKLIGAGQRNPEYYRNLYLASRKLSNIRNLSSISSAANTSASILSTTTPWISNATTYSTSNPVRKSTSAESATNAISIAMVALTRLEKLRGLRSGSRKLSSHTLAKELSTTAPNTTKALVTSTATITTTMATPTAQTSSAVTSTANAILPTTTLTIEESTKRRFTTIHLSPPNNTSQFAASKLAVARKHSQSTATSNARSPQFSSHTLTRITPSKTNLILAQSSFFYEPTSGASSVLPLSERENKQYSSVAPKPRSQTTNESNPRRYSVSQTAKQPNTTPVTSSMPSTRNTNGTEINTQTTFRSTPPTAIIGTNAASTATTIAVPVARATTNRSYVTWPKQLQLIRSALKRRFSARSTPEETTTLLMTTTSQALTPTTPSVTKKINLANTYITDPGELQSTKPPTDEAKNRRRQIKSRFTAPIQDRDRYKPEEYITLTTKLPKISTFEKIFRQPEAVFDITHKPKTKRFPRRKNRNHEIYNVQHHPVHLQHSSSFTSPKKIHREVNPGALFHAGGLQKAPLTLEHTILPVSPALHRLLPAENRLLMASNQALRPLYETVSEPYHMAPYSVQRTSFRMPHKRPPVFDSTFQKPTNVPAGPKYYEPLKRFEIEPEPRSPPAGFFRTREKDTTVGGKLKLPNLLDPFSMIDHLMQSDLQVKQKEKTRSGLHVPLPMGMRPISIQVLEEDETRDKQLLGLGMEHGSLHNDLHTKPATAAPVRSKDPGSIFREALRRSTKKAREERRHDKHKRHLNELIKECEQGAKYCELAWKRFSLQEEDARMENPAQVLRDGLTSPNLGVQLAGGLAQMIAQNTTPKLKAPEYEADGNEFGGWQHSRQSKRNSGIFMSLPGMDPVFVKGFF